MTSVIPWRPQSNLFVAACELARQGTPVFPCAPGSKAPATVHGYLDATTDRTVIRRWWGAMPAANIGVPTGIFHGIPTMTVLDVDVRLDVDGRVGLRRLAAKGLVEGWSQVVATPSGGYHLYYAGDPRRCSSIPAARIDLKATGGYVLVSPSRIGGKTYQVVATSDSAPSAVRWELMHEVLAPRRSGRRGRRQLTAGKPSLEALVWHLAGQTEGNRNSCLFWCCHRAIDDGFTTLADLRPLIDTALLIGLSLAEAEHCALSALRRSGCAA